MENATQTADDKLQTSADEPVYTEGGIDPSNRKKLGFCCMCGPAVGLLLVFLCWPLATYMTVKLAQAGVLPSYAQPILLIGMMALWPIFALGTLVGIPVGIVILNKSNKS